MNRISALALASLLALAGCGGSGGSEEATPVGPRVTAVSGVAAKGPIKQAKVLVCRIVNGAPEPDANCTAGTTASDGTYSVTMRDGYSGPAMVKVMSMAGSTMMDETTGTDVPYGMTMRALVPVVSSGTIAYVTPFSEMAAQAMSLSLPMDATKMSQASAAVQAAMINFGVNMSTMPMIDLKNDGSNAAVLGEEANMVKQLARVAMAAKNSSLLVDPNGTPCNATGTTTSQQFACAVSAMSGVMTSYVSYDAAKMATLIATMTAQNVTTVTMLMRNVDGSTGMQTIDMSSFTSMQNAMQSSGMAPNTAASTTSVIMGGMH